MASANINLKSGENYIVKNLVSISVEDFGNTPVKHIAPFDSFYLRPDEWLSFVGAKETVAIQSNDIEYVVIERD